MDQVRADARWERFGAVAGIVFVALTVVAYAIVAPYPATDDSVQEIAAYFDEGGRVLTSLYLNGLAVPFFVWFLGSLRALLRRVEGETGGFSAVSVIGGSVFAALAATGLAVFAALAFGDPERRDPDVLRALFDLGTVIFVFSLFAAAACIAGAAAVMVATGVGSRLLGSSGLAVAVYQAFAGASFANSGPLSPTGAVPTVGHVLFLIWVLAASVAMLVRPWPPDTQVSRRADDRGGGPTSP